MFSTIALQCLVLPMLIAVSPSALSARAESRTLALATEAAASDVSRSLALAAPPTLNAPIADAVRNANPTELPASEPTNKSSTPKKRHGARRGALIGFLVGAGSGTTIGLLSGDDPPGLIRFSAEDKAVMLGVWLGFVGTVVGAAAAAINAHPQRHIVETRRVHLSVGASPRRGVTARATVRF